MLNIVEGRLLAVSDEAAVISLIDSHTGKIVHQLECSKLSETAVCCLGWGFNVTNSSVFEQLDEQLKDRVPLDDLLAQDVSNVVPEISADLPSELAFLDVDGVLPRLSVLPPSGKEYVGTARFRDFIDTAGDPVTRCLAPGHPWTLSFTCRERTPIAMEYYNTLVILVLRLMASSSRIVYPTERGCP